MARAARLLGRVLTLQQSSPTGGPALRAQRRFLRARNGALSPEAIASSCADEAPTATHRTPPNALALDYITAKVPSDAVADRRTEPLVWSAPTLKAAWRSLYNRLGEVEETDPLRAAELREKDLVALALCTAQAETLHLLSLLPPPLRGVITSNPLFDYAEVEELFIHLGQDIEVRGGKWVLQLPPPSAADLQYITRAVGKFGDDGRGCIPGTAHRVSAWRGRHGESLGVTVRVGRFVPNAARALLPFVQRGSLLILSRAGMGKTTLLRDIAASVAQGPGKPRVTVVDTSNEVGGDGPVPMPFLGRCRRIQVPTRERQSQTMTEVIQNHSPEYLVVDELATAEEAQAAWSIAQRGVRLVATCHGETLAGLLQNQSLNLLVGGAAQAFLSNEERRLRNKTKKTILERPHSSPFQYVVELNSRTCGYAYVDVNQAVDLILDDKNPKGNAAVGGPITLEKPLPDQIFALLAAQDRAARRVDGARLTGRESSEAGEEDAEGSLLGRPTVDGDGYLVSQPRATRPGGFGRDGGRHTGTFTGSEDGAPRKQTADGGAWESGNRSRHGRSTRKTDTQLLKELGQFF